MIRFYFHPTPNPVKVALFLEEARLPYEVIPVDTSKGEQHLPAFRAINPNGKVPAIIDTEGPGGRETRVFDSTAILLYLAEKTGQFLGAPDDRPELLSWLLFLASGLGPFSGQAVHFQFSAPEGLDYAVNRYRREAERHYQVLDDHLEGRTPYRGEHVHDCRHVGLGLAGSGLAGAQGCRGPAWAVSEPQAPLRDGRRAAGGDACARRRQGSSVQEDQRRRDPARTVPVQLPAGGVSRPRQSWRRT